MIKTNSVNCPHCGGHLMNIQGDSLCMDMSHMVCPNCGKKPFPGPVC